MRENTTRIYERDLMYAIGGQLFEQAPNRDPRKAEIIMKKVKEGFRSVAINNNEWYFVRTDKKLYEFINDLLFAIPEFEELNLSQIEYENGVTVDDPNRSRFNFVSAYDLETSESWKDDFIDLDAFVGNVVRKLSQEENDCFCCEHENTGRKECLYCKWNVGLRDNYKGNRYPKGDYMLSCKYDCKEGCYICCIECNQKEGCTSICDSNPDVCTNKCHDLRGKSKGMDIDE